MRPFICRPGISSTRQVASSSCGQPSSTRFTNSTNSEDCLGSRRHGLFPATSSLRRLSTGVYSSSSSPDYGTQNDASVDALKREIEGLERERLDASAKGEALASKTSKLTATILTFQEQAFAAVQRGDEEAARSLLQSKAAASKVLEKATERSRANLLLAAKLEEIIGRKQTELIALLARVGKIKVEPIVREPIRDAEEDFRSIEARFRLGPELNGDEDVRQEKGRGANAREPEPEKLWEDPTELHDALERKFQSLEKEDLKEKQKRLERLWDQQ